jgi:isopenicillin-N N-acyltransferase-like protein
MKVIEASGDNYRIGCIVGKKIADEIHHFLSLDMHKDRMLGDKAVSKILEHCRAVYPQFLEELNGMADGSGIDFLSLFKYNITGLGKVAENCTSVAVSSDDKILFGHNEDAMHGKYDCYLQKMKIGKQRVMAVTYFGQLPGISVSVNSSGVFQSCNALLSSDVRVGLPLSFILRASIESSSIEEAFSVVTQAGRSRGENYRLYKGGSYIDVETSATDFRLVDTSGSYAVHTNHYLHPELLRYERNDRDLASSKARYNTAMKMLGDAAKKPRTSLTFKTIKDILSSHSKPLPICRHHAPSDACDTLATILADTSKKELRVCYGNPCDGKFRVYGL